MEPIRILVADDHPVVREGLVAMLATQDDFQVVGQAADGEQVLTYVAHLQPAVLLLDLEMPRLDGLQVLQHLGQHHPDVKVIVFTAFDTDERIVGAVQAGAQGYLLKGAPRAQLFEAIRLVSQGGSLLQPIVASKLMQHVSDAAHQRTSPDSLTPREMDVMRLLAQGQTNKEIARQLVISERTVKFHVSAVLRKLGAGNRTEAVKLAAQRGLIDLNTPTEDQD